MIFAHTYNGIPVRTGDIICTRDGVEGSLFGALWQLLGRLVPGEIDHCIVYIGPGGRCVESGARGVAVFEMPGPAWDAAPLAQERALLDTLVGVAYPLANLRLSAAAEARLRSGVAAYCLNHVIQAKPYNINYFDPATDGAFYCSQLVYKAYLEQGVDLNTDTGVLSGPLLSRIVFPQEIWNSCHHVRLADQKAVGADESQPGAQANNKGTVTDGNC